jgi:hypothetical protein
LREAAFWRERARREELRSRRAGGRESASRVGRRERRDGCVVRLIAVVVGGFWGWQGVGLRVRHM